MGLKRRDQSIRNTAKPSTSRDTTHYARVEPILYQVQRFPKEVRNFKRVIVISVANIFFLRAFE